MNLLSCCIILLLAICVAKADVSFQESIRTMAQNAQWTTCPPSQTDYYPSQYLRDCITLQFPLDRSDPSLGMVNAFLRRFYVTTLTNDSLWLIEGGPGFSTRPFIPVADYFLAANNNLTAYLLDARGTGLSSLLTCNHSNENPGFTFNPYNVSNVEQFTVCNDQIIAEYRDVLQYYNSYDSALDLLGAINFINPGTVSIYALSYGTYFTNVYMQLPGARFDCIVLDGPVPPNRWVLEDSVMTNSLASQDVLNLCATNSSVCNAALGEMGDLPQLVMEAVYDQTLPCLQYLPWLNATDRNILTGEFTNFMTATQSAQPLLAPFWYRLYRCSASDVEQLNYYYSVRIKQLYPNLMSVYDYSYGLGVNIAVNELYSFQPKNQSITYKEQVFLTNVMFADGGGQLTNSYALYESNFPSYPHNPNTYLKFANVSVPVLILVGTLDPNTIQGLGLWFHNGLGNTSQLITVPYATHGTANPGAPCVDGIITEFFATLGTAQLDTSCLNDLVPPDFDGSEAQTQSLSQEYFGTTDLWNNGYQKDVNPVPTTCTDDDSSSSNSDWSNSEVNSLIAGLVVPFTLIILGLAGYVFYLHYYVLGSNNSGMKEKLVQV
jgi:pimeloyl-ACP methyl ester carboxylesterase